MVSPKYEYSTILMLYLNIMTSKFYFARINLQSVMMRTKNTQERIMNMFCAKEKEY